MCVVVVAVSLLVPDTARRFRTQGGHCRHHMRANSQTKRAGASRYVSAGDVRRKIQWRACFSARTVVKSSGLGAQRRRNWDGFRTQEGHCRQHMCANSQTKRAGASRYASASDVRRKIQRRACFSARKVVSHRVWVHSPDAIGTDFAPKEGTAGTICAQIAR